MNGTQEPTPLDNIKNAIRQRFAKPQTEESQGGALGEAENENPMAQRAQPQQPISSTLPTADPATRGQITAQDALSVPAAANPMAMTRPRTVAAAQRPPEPTRPRYAGQSTVDLFGQPLTRTAKTGAELNVMRQAPRGAEIQQTGDRVGYSATPPKRGFRRALKEGAELATTYGREHPGDPYGMLTAGALGMGSSAVQPNVINREFQQRKTEAQLQKGLAEQGEKAKIQAAQSLPMYRQAEIDLGAGRLQATQERNRAYMAHLEGLPQEKQAEGARKMWMAGVADGNPELKAELARRMGLKEELPDTDKGSVQVDGKGNYQVVHGRTATAKTVEGTTTGAEGETTKIGPVSSYKKTVEDDRNERFAKSQALREKLAKMGWAEAMKRAQVMAGAAGARLGDPDEYETWAEDLESKADTLEKSGTKTDKTNAGKLRTQANDMRVRGSKARSAQRQSGTSGQAKGGRTLKGAIEAWKRAHPDHREPNAQELEQIKALPGIKDE